MRLAIALAVLVAALFLTPLTASAAPLALGDHAKLVRDVSAGAVDKVRYRTTKARHAKRYAYNGPRRYNWQYYPYWRPYYYYYWQHYYPYGGPLF